MTDYSKARQADITITDPSAGHVLPFMCLKEADGCTPFYRELDSKHLVDLFDSDTPTQTSTNPEIELLIGQSDWRAGFGLERQDLNDPRRYHVGNMDMRFKGRGMASWGSTALTLPTSAILSLTDGGLEDWTNDTTLNTDNWTYTATDGDWTINKEAAEVHTGTYSARFESGAAAIDQNSYAQVSQAAVTWSNDLRGKEFIVTCAVYTDNRAISKAQLIIYDGQDTTTVESSTDDAWEILTAEHTFNANADQCTVILRAFQVAAGPQPAEEVYFDTVRFPTDGTTVAFAEFDEDLFMTKGCYLLRMNHSTGTVAVEAGFPQDITDLVPFQVDGTDYLFIFQGTTYAYFYMETDETITRYTSANYMQYGAWVNTTADVLYANDGDNTIWSNSDPLNGGDAWADETVVGDAATAITHLQEKDGALLIDKEDMPYYLDSSGNVQKDLAPECKSGKSSHSGKNSCIWLGEYFRPTGDQSLLRSGTSNSWIQPSKYGTDISEYSGQVEACVGDEEWLYCITDRGSSIYVLAGREETIDNTSSWRWHPLHDLDEGNESTEILRPTSAGDETSVTHATGTHYQDVDEAVADDATTMVYTASTDTYGYYRDLYNLDNTAITDVITGITVTARMRKTADVGHAYITIKTGGTLYSTYVSLTSSWTNYSRTWATNPNTGVAWTAANINALQIGIYLVGGTSVGTTYDAQCTQVYLTTSYVTSFDLETAYISSIYQKRLYLTSDSSSNSIFYYPLPTKYGDITSDDNRDFLTNTYFETSWLHGGFPTDNKAYADLTVSMGHAYDANIYFEAYYKLLGDTSWTFIDNFTGSSSTMMETIELSTVTNERTSPMIKLKFVAVTDDSDYTPVLLDYKLRAILYPSNPKKIIWTRVVVKEKEVDNYGVPYKALYTKKISCLENIRNATSWITIKHYLDSDSGTTKYVKLLPLPQSEAMAWRTPVKKSNKEKAEWVYNLLMLDTGLS